MVTDLGDQPTPEIEPGEPPPGGVDAVEDQKHDPDPVVPDLTLLGNTPAKDEIPDVLTEPDGTDDETASDAASTPREEKPS